MAKINWKNKEEVLEYRRQYYQKNRKRELERRRQYYQRNRRRELERQRQTIHRRGIQKVIEDAQRRGYSKEFAEAYAMDGVLLENYKDKLIKEVSQ